MGEDEVLNLEGFGVGIRERVILADVSLSVPARGTLVIMGPAGGGKSTLLRTLSGLNQSQPELRQWGASSYAGAALDGRNRPVLVQQDVRHFVSTVRENLVSAFGDRARLTREAQNQRLETLLAAAGVPELAERLDDDAVLLPAALRRVLSVLRAMASGAALVCLDETTVGLDPDAAERVLGLIRWYARDHAVLFVTHHQGHARAVADRVVFLAGGRVQEEAAAPVFFEAPRESVTRHFLATGGANLPSPDADPATLADDAPRPPPLPPAARIVPATLGPRGFGWLIPGKLGGLPRPGIVAEVADDLAALTRLGVDTLVTLEEQRTVPLEALAAAGIASIHFPVVDMEAPQTVDTAVMCRRVAARLAEGGVVAYHCRAGHGRTGTLLACQLIWAGVSAVDALDRVRSVNPRWVTSEAQVRFLEVFFEFVRWQGGQAPGSTQLHPQSPTP